MIKIVYIILFLNIINSLTTFAASIDPINTEHQIRLCDSKQSILEKLKLDNLSSGFKASFYKVYYLETLNRDLEKNQWSIRVRAKKNKAEITIKKKFLNIPSNVSYSPDMICEYDLHGAVKEYSCKINADISNSEFESVIKKQKNWLDVLDSSQVKFLKDFNANFENVLVFGTLNNERLQWEHPSFGTITLDLVELENSTLNTFHEISIRYPAVNGGVTSLEFEKYFNSKGIKACLNQASWPVDKFNLFKIIN